MKNKNLQRQDKACIIALIVCVLLFIILLSAYLGGNSGNFDVKSSYNGGGGTAIIDNTAENSNSEVPGKAEETEKSTENVKQPMTGATEESVQIVSEFDIYTEDFGKSVEAMKTLYGSDMQHQSNWVGADWYSIGNQRLLGFNIADGVLGGAIVPLTDIYPEIDSIADSAGIVTKEEFEKYIGQNVEFVPLDVDAMEFDSPFLSYTYNGSKKLFVRVFCDSNGSFDVVGSNSEPASCMFICMD